MIVANTIWRQASVAYQHLLLVVVFRRLEFFLEPRDKFLYNLLLFLAPRDPRYNIGNLIPRHPVESHLDRPSLNLSLEARLNGAPQGSWYPSGLTTLKKSVNRTRVTLLKNQSNRKGRHWIIGWNKAQMEPFWVFG